MAQGQNRLVCECGEQFNNQETLEQHRMQCPTAQAHQQSEGSGRTRAMGSGGQEEEVEQ
jgi:hypothetical protein